MTVTMEDGKCTKTRLILVESNIGDETVVSDPDGLRETSLRNH